MKTPKLDIFKFIWLIYIGFSIFNFIYLQNSVDITSDNNDQHKQSFPPRLPLLGANCSIAWRKQQRLDTNVKEIHNLVSPTHPTTKYAFKGTFSYWLSHIDSQNWMFEKAFFVNKYTVKKYIQNYANLYPQFKWLNHAKVLYNVQEIINDTYVFPSFDEIIQLKHKYGGFVVKPNHISVEPLVFDTNNHIDRIIFDRIVGKAKKWMLSNGNNRERWYEMIPPQVFIEEHLNVDPNKGYVLTLYDFAVLNGKALFVDVSGNQKKDASYIYVLPEYKLLNVSWEVSDNKGLNYKKPSKKNLERMIDFSEHFAKRERLNFVDVYLYEINDKIYFSEFKFISNAGVMKPLSFDYLLYDYLCDSDAKDIASIRDYLM